jgi:diphthamide biosynthesis protein 3
MSYYDEIEIEDMTFDPALQIYHFPCPCGDRFEISLGDLHDGEEVAVCPSCSLMIKVIFEVVRGPLRLQSGQVLTGGQDGLPPEVTDDVAKVPIAT